METKDRTKRLPLWAVVVLDALALGAALVVFALFHHVLPQTMEPAGLRSVSATPLPTAAPARTPEPSPEAAEALQTPEEPERAEEPDGRSPWAIRFEEHFTDAVTVTENSYSSPNVSVEIRQMDMRNGEHKNVCYVADIYIADIRCLRSYLAHDTYGRGIVQDILGMAQDSGAIAAITGDMYAYQGASLMLRNGELYRDGRWQPYQTHCVLFYDGTMAVYGPEEIDYEQAMADGAWQIWSFGPILVRGGEMGNDFSSGMAVESENPRTALGCFEPGHYCFVAVDGRRPSYSYGMTFEELAQVMLDLGCECAYNLDGGGSTAMAFNGALANIPSGGGRELSDIILVAEPPAEEAAAEESGAEE